MTPKPSYAIRRMTLAEVENIAVEWAAREGWNPGLHDAPCFFATDPQGFFVGLLGDEPVSCISAVAYDQHFAFIGFYIVKPEHRGRGYGLKIWNAALAHLQEQNIGLDGVVERQADYQKHGFKLAYRNIRYEGTAESAAQRFPEVVRLAEVSFDDLVRYDTALFPTPRPRFLRCWIEQPNGLALAARRNGGIVGYSVIRKCRVGYKIGPLFADDKEIAHQLLRAAGDFLEPGSKIYLDVPEANPAAVQLAQGLGMQKVFETARMYTKAAPKIDLKRIFGVTTFELG